MTVAEAVMQHVEALPESVQAEILDFVEFIELKRGRTQSEDSQWSSLSISQAMRGMEEEETPYTLVDLKERFA